MHKTLAWSACLLLVGIVIGIASTNSSRGSRFIQAACLSFDLHRLFCRESNQATYWRQIIGQQMRRDKSVKPGSVVFFGDSHVQGLVVSNIIRNGVNFGIGGENSGQLLKRLNFYQSPRTAQAIVLATGTNDTVNKHHNTVENVCAILDQVNRPVLLSALFPVDETHTKFRRNEDIQKINQSLGGICKIGCLVLNVADRLSDNKGNLIHHDGDGVHLNTVGYRIWEKAMRDGLRKLEKFPAGQARCSNG